MYKLNVTFSDGSTFKHSYNETKLRNALRNGFSGVVEFGEVETPSGVKKDVTQILIQSSKKI